VRPTSRFSVSRPAGLKVSALDRRAQSVRVESLDVIAMAAGATASA